MAPGYVFLGSNGISPADFWGVTVNHHQKVGGFHPKILGSTQQKSWMQQLLFTLWLFKIAMV